jgi:hypothetical protein
LAPKPHLTQQLADIRLATIISMSPTSSTDTAVYFTAFLTFTSWYGMNTATGHTNWDESVSYLTHDDSPICTTRNRSSNGGKFSFPVWPYRIYAQRGMMTCDI